MAITRAQQARQMLKKGTSKPVVQGGVDNYLGKQPQVVAPRKWQSGPDKPPTELAYITEAEKKLLLKEDIHGSLKKGPNVGPSGIMSLDSFGDADGSGMAGGDVSRAERGDFGPIGGGGGGGPKLPPGVTRKTKPTKTEQELRSAFIAAGGGQRVNPGFFDSRNRVSPQELALARQFTRRGDATGDLARLAMKRTRGGGIMNFITGGGFLGNLVRGLGQRFGLGKRFDQPTYDMRQFSGINSTFQNDLGNPLLEQLAEEEDENKIPIVIDDDMSLIPRKNLNDYDGVTPFQRDVIEDTQDQADDPFLKGAMAELSQKQLDYLNSPKGKSDLKLLGPGGVFKNRLPLYEDKPFFGFDQEPTTPEEFNEYLDSIGAPKIKVADGGRIGAQEGGIMDLETGRQMYFLGKLVKKATRAVKKIVKSPVGRLGLFAAASAIPFGDKGSLFKRFMALDKGKQMLAGAGLLSAAPFIIGQEEEEQPAGFTGSVGGQIDPRAYTDPYGVLYGAFKAEGGSMKDEPVAKRTMPLLDMGGQEMDLRAEGGFVPIGRMEKADDVPARLSKNEFVFTADAVRNAGDGDVDKGAEVMYNMMKNLEAGGEVSEESQGLEGAREMFQTSKRLEDVL